MLELNYSFNTRVQEHNWRKNAEENGWIADGPKPDLRFNGDTDEIDGFEFELVVEDDYDLGGDPGESDEVLGTLTDSPEKSGAFKVNPRVARIYYHDTQRYSLAERLELPELWWNPMEPVEELQGYYQKSGASKQVSRELATASNKSAMERRLYYGEYNGWNWVTVGVKVSKNGIELGSEFIGGVESDFFETGYANELIPDLADSALGEAKEAIEELTS